MFLIPYGRDEVDTRTDSDWYCHLLNIKSQGQHKAALSCYSGSIVEGTFNIMDDVLKKDKTSMTQQNLKA